eukprot:5369972-Pleurochrysis_carterae.AAC.1
MAIESLRQAHYDNGLAENTLTGFNTFYHDYDIFNRSLPAHERLSESVMSEKLAHVVRRVSELAGALLDVTITMSRATGQLSPTVTAIRDVLSELEAREQKSAFETNNRGRAFLAQQDSAAHKPGEKPRDKPLKKGDPK